MAAMLGLVAAITVGALALGSDDPAAAAGLEQFDSCAAIEEWAADVAPPPGFPTDDVAVLEEGGRATGSDGDDAAVAAPSAAGSEGGGSGEATASFDQAQAPAPSTATAEADASGTGGTNTVVEGVDEIDVIDRVADDRLLVSRNGVLALVDLTGRTVVAELGGLPFDARISVDGDLVWIAGSSNDGSGTEVRRVRIAGDSLTDDGTFASPGYLLDARRTGDRFHVVAVDHPQSGVIPFEGGPVPCDDVWRPVAPATTPSATLVMTFPAEGDLAPTAAAEVTGAAGNLLVTDTSLYVATETYTEDGQIDTGLHRFDLDSLTPTGSGSVPGTLAGPFSLSEFEGNLRVATSASGGGFIGRPIPVEGVGEGAPTEDGDVIIEEPAVGGPAIDVAPGADVDVAQATPAQAPTDPPEPVDTTIVGDPTSTTVVEETTTTTEAPTTTTEATTTTTEATTTVPETTVPEETTTVPADDSALAEVFVLDTEGDLDLIGRTGRFGHDFETIHGVRFVGDTAYVVTFLQTDPFWVIDLSDPTAPAVVGELQIPGFSGYLHPVGEGRVVGFGPDGNGAVAARLFDVSDPSAPSVLDEIQLGDDSPVVFDHHAFVGLAGGRFAVPVTDYPEYVFDDGDCRVFPTEPVPLPEPLPAPDPRPVDPGTGAVTTVPPDSVDSGGSTSGGGQTGSTGVAIGEPVPVCEPVPVGGASGAAVLEVADGRLSLVERPTVDRPDIYAARVVLAPDGTWLVLSYDRLVATDDGSDLLLPTG